MNPTNTPTRVDIARASTIIQTWMHRLELDQIDTPMALLEAAETMCNAYHARPSDEDWAPPHGIERPTFYEPNTMTARRLAFWVALGASTWVSVVVAAVLICRAAS